MGSGLGGMGRERRITFKFLPSLEGVDYCKWPLPSARQRFAIKGHTALWGGRMPCMSPGYTGSQGRVGLQGGMPVTSSVRGERGIDYTCKGKPYHCDVPKECLCCNWFCSLFKNKFAFITLIITIHYIIDID